VKETLEALVAEMVEKGILFDEARAEFERRFIQRVLDLAHGNRSNAAQTLGMHRNTLSRKMGELHLVADNHADARKSTRSARA